MSVQGVHSSNVQQLQHNNFKIKRTDTKEKTIKNPKSILVHSHQEEDEGGRRSHVLHDA